MIECEKKPVIAIELGGFHLIWITILMITKKCEYVEIGGTVNKNIRFDYIAACQLSQVICSNFCLLVMECILKDKPINAQLLPDQK